MLPKEKSKLVICVKEHYTSKTCSYCGWLYNVGKSKVYNCLQCKNTMDRYINASKNILLKGLMEL
jgi:transposase